MRIESKHIRNAVARYFRCLPSKIDSKSRKRNVVIMRQVAHYLGWKHHSGSLYEIGSDLGGKDHATVLHSKKQIENAIDTGEYFLDTKIEQIVKDCEALAKDMQMAETRKNNELEMNNFECEFIMC